MANTISDSATVADVSGTPQFARLENVYELRDRAEIVKYLNNHAFLLDILEEAPAKIREVFPDAPLALEFIQDFESPANSRLSLFIKSTYDVEESLERKDNLQSSWWFKVLRTLPVLQRADMNLSLEF